MNIIIHLIDLVTTLKPKKIQIPASLLKGIIAATLPNTAKHTVNYTGASSDLQLH